ncbi:MAG TPA: alpha/beta hydrolase [Mycobacterium sp.]|nr:alpha/beta hydrolase [Mycobacterium sp.]
MAAGAFRFLGATTVVEAMVTWLSRRGGSAPCGRRDRVPGHGENEAVTPESWRAALGPYRATTRNTRPPGRYAELHRHWTEAPRSPSLYLYGHDDGCVTPAFASWTERVLPVGSDVAIVEHAGHFLQLEQPDKVAELVLAFIGSAG